MKKIKLYTAVSAFLVCALASCGNEPPLSESKTVDLVIKMHETDALMFVTGYSDATLRSDSISYYNYIFKEAGVTKQEFLETIDWYTQHPERYKTLYQKVVEKMTKDDNETRKKNDQNRQKAKNDLWDLPSFYSMPTDGITNPIAYEYPTDVHGVYTISADFTYYADDGTVDPRLCIIADYHDGTNEYILTRGFKKDGIKRTYTAKIKTNEKKDLKAIRGWVCDQGDATKSKHVDVSNIQLLYTKE